PGTAVKSSPRSVQLRRRSFHRGAGLSRRSFLVLTSNAGHLDMRAFGSLVDVRSPGGVCRKFISSFSYAAGPRQRLAPLVSVGGKNHWLLLDVRALAIGWPKTIVRVPYVVSLSIGLGRAKR